MSAETGESLPTTCESCDRESRHLAKLTAPDNSVRYVCWSCLYRQEKRVNVKETWKRQGRSRG